MTSTFFFRHLNKYPMIFVCFYCIHKRMRTKCSEQKTSEFFPKIKCDVFMTLYINVWMYVACTQRIRFLFLHLSCDWIGWNRMKMSGTKNSDERLEHWTFKYIVLLNGWCFQADDFFSFYIFLLFWWTYTYYLHSLIPTTTTTTTTKVDWIAWTMGIFMYGVNYIHGCAFTYVLVTRHHREKKRRKKLWP